MSTQNTQQSTSTSTSINDATSSNDYKNLLNEIKNTIDRNDILFKQIQQANYPNAGNYTSDLLNYKIDTQVSDLTRARQTVWDFVNKKYQENSKLRSFYFNEIRKADTHINEITEQQQTLLDSIAKKQLLNTTSNTSIKQQKYILDKKTYYLFLYKLLSFIQIIILIFITLCITGLISRATCLIIIVIILLATLAFTAYYVFYVNIGRSAFSWGKFEHDNSIKSKGGQCTTDSEGITPADKQRAETDIKIKELIKQNMSTTKCKEPEPAPAPAPATATATTRSQTQTQTPATTRSQTQTPATTRSL